MTALWIGVFVIAFLAGIAAGVWLLVLAFQEHVGWGFACLLIPFAALAFALKYWEEAKKPFLYSLASSVLAAIGVVGYSVSAVNADLGAYTDLGGSMSADDRPMSAAFDVEPIYSPDPLESADDERIGSAQSVDNGELGDPEVEFESLESDEAVDPEQAAEDLPRRSYNQDKSVVIPVSALHTMVGELVKIELSSGERMSVRVEAVDDNTAHVRHRVGGGSVAYAIDLEHIVEVRARKEK